MVDKNQKQKSFEEGYMKGTEYLHEAMKESASAERERIFKDLEDVFILYKVGKEKRWMIPIELYGVIKKRHSAEIEKEE